MEYRLINAKPKAAVVESFSDFEASLDALYNALNGLGKRGRDVAWIIPMNVAGRGEPTLETLELNKWSFVTEKVVVKGVLVAIRMWSFDEVALYAVVDSAFDVDAEVAAIRERVAAEKAAEKAEKEARRVALAARKAEIAAEKEAKAKAKAEREAAKVAKSSVAHYFPYNPEAIGIVKTVTEGFRAELTEFFTASISGEVESIVEAFDAFVATADMSDWKAENAFIKSLGRAKATYFRLVDVSASGERSLIGKTERAAWIKKEVDGAVEAAIGSFELKLAKKLSGLIENRGAKLSISGWLDSNSVRIDFENGDGFDLYSKVELAISPLGKLFERYPTRFGNVIIDGKPLKAPSEASVKKALGVK